MECTEATSAELGRHFDGTETETDSVIMSFLRLQTLQTHQFPCRKRLVSQIPKAQSGAAQDVACGGKVLACHAGLLLTPNIMLTDAKSSAAAVNKGIFLRLDDCR